ncbi:Fe-S cluster assembly protein SufD [Bacteriovoracaceae bacterium]|nr:Fe-S cluster assembly protein SufD [Bacteriovoracaceae bacterium]
MHFENYYNEHKKSQIFPKDSAKCYDRFMATGIPTNKVESWKYTNLNTWLNAAGEVPSSSISVEVAFKTSSITKNTSDVSFYDYENAPAKLKANVFNLLSNVYQDDPIYQFLLSTIDKVQIIHIHAKAIVKQPILIKRAAGKNYYTIVLADKSSHASILEIMDDQSNEKKFTQGITRVLLEDNAKVDHVVVQSLHYSQLSNIYCGADVKRDANYTNNLLSFGASMSRNNLKIKLLESGSSTESYGLCALNGNQHNDNQTSIEHLAPHTESTQLYKGILDEKSRTIFSGIIYVAKGAQLISSNQLNKNLILSNSAHANSQPQLEVFADDVKCAHGSTTGQLDPEQLFYFLSRAITPERARAKLSHGFCNDIIEKIKNPDIRKFVNIYLNHNFTQMVSLK